MRFPFQTSGHLIQANILLPVVLCYISGGLLAHWLCLDRTPLHYLAALAILTLPALFIVRRSRYILLYTLPLFVLTGLIHTGYGLLPPDDPGHIYNRITSRTKVTLTGTVAKMTEYNGHKTRFILEADSILIHRQEAGIEKQVPTTGKIRLSFKGQFIDNVRPGDHLMVLAKVNRVSSYSTPGVFDYRLFLASRSIHVAGTIQSPAQILPFLDATVPWYKTVRFMPERVRHDIGTFLDKNLKPKSAGLYRALLIGSRSGISQATLEQYKATGCMHLLAISGVHMGLLGMMISLGLAWLMKRSRYLLLHTHIPTLATLLTLLPLVGYAFIAGLNTPVLRALVMAVFFLIVVVLKRQKSILHIIAAAALIVLIFKPLALFTVSFQLSFSAVLAIALIYPRLVSLLDQKQLSPGKKLYTYICAALFVSIAATLGSLPFMLLHFNRFSTIGPFMNLLIEPLLCLWSLPIGLLAMPLIYLSPDIAAALLKVGTVGILAADRITLAGSTFPFASLWSITPNNGEIILFYGLLLLWIYRSKTAYRKLSLLSVSALFLLFFTKGLWFTFPGKISEVTFLDIGQGTSTLIELPHGGTVLLDGGSKTSPHFDVGERVIAPFLWKKQLWQIDDVIITHPHSDHFNGLSFIFSHFRPKRVWVNGSSSESNQYRDLLRLASKKNISIHIPEPGQRLVTEKRAEIICLNGGEQNHMNSSSAGKPDNFTLNDLSLIIKFEHGNSSFLFPGDISKKMEYSLIDQGADLKAEVLLAPHHGSKGSGSRRFISAVNPDLIVISAGQNGRGQYLDPGHLKQWQKDERKVLITSRNGTVTCWSDGTDLHVKTIYGRALVIKPR